MVSNRKPGSYWRYGLAAFGCLIAAGLFGWLLQPEKPRFSGNSGYETISASYQAGGSDCEPTRLNRLVGRKGEAKRDACAEAEEQHREATDSLIEARRAADASDASAVLAYKQTGVAAWGTAVGFLTLLAAICAAWFAERAAAHTKRSADEAERSNVELIANLVPFDILVQADNGLHDLVKFKNVGKTSAEVHTLTWRLMERAPENPEWVFEDSNLEKLDFIIIADFEIAVLAIARTADNLSCFIGQLGYTDITGRERNSTFRYDRGINGWISAGGREWNISA